MPLGALVAAVVAVAATLSCVDANVGLGARMQPRPAPYGLPDVDVAVGERLHYRILDEAFDGVNNAYEVRARPCAVGM